MILFLSDWSDQIWEHVAPELSDFCSPNSLILKLNVCLSTSEAEQGSRCYGNMLYIRGDLMSLSVKPTV